MRSIFHHSIVSCLLMMLIMLITACASTKEQARTRSDDQGGTPAEIEAERSQLVEAQIDQWPNDPAEVAALLGLNAEQTAAFLDYWDAHQRRLQEIENMDPNDIDGRRRAMLNASNSSKNILKGIFTDEQWKAYRNRGGKAGK